MEDRSELVELVKWLRKNKGKRPSRRLGAPPGEEKAALILVRLNGYAKQGPPPPHLQSLVDEVTQVCLTIDLHFPVLFSPNSKRVSVVVKKRSRPVSYSDMVNHF